MPYPVFTFKQTVQALRIYLPQDINMEGSPVERAGNTGNKGSTSTLVAYIYNTAWQGRKHWELGSVNVE